MKPGHPSLVVLAAACASLLYLYRDVLAGLVADWSTDDNYSHGFLIVPLAAYFVWQRRADISAAPASSSLLGLGTVVAGLGMLLAGLLGADRLLPRLSLLVVLAGAVWFVRGWATLRLTALPMAFLLLMIPMPAIIFNQIAFPLQLLASQTGEVVLSAAGIPVLREGNVIVLATTALEVAEACSGIRSLISLLTLGIVFGYFSDSRTWVRAAIALSTIPIAIVANAARVAGTGIAAHYGGRAAAEGFFHTFSGWLVFLVAFVLVVAVARAVTWASPEPMPAAVS